MNCRGLKQNLKHEGFEIFLKGKKRLKDKEEM